MPINTRVSGEKVKGEGGKPKVHHSIFVNKTFGNINKILYLAQDHHAV